MRIAVSGTHCSGKSTLIEVFLSRHPDYVHEPEAYEALQESFGDEPSADDFFRQLEFQIERLKQYRLDDRVIFERSPFDYVAYLQALLDLKRDNAELSLAEQAMDLARDSIEFLDMIVYLPAHDVQIHVPDEEDRELRLAMDRRLEDLLNRDQTRLLVEATGTTAQRLETLERALSKLQ